VQAGYSEGPPAGIPENTLFLINTVESKKDTIYIVGQGKPLELIFSSGQEVSLWDVLEENKVAFTESNDIQIIVEETAKKVDAELLLIELKWLARYGLTPTTINFDADVDKK